MSVGLDAHQIANEREQFIEARIQQHIRELDAMPVHGGGILSPALRGHQREQQSNFAWQASCCHQIRTLPTSRQTTGSSYLSG